MPHPAHERQILPVLLWQEGSDLDSLIRFQEVELVHSWTLEVRARDEVLIFVVNIQNSLISMEEILALV